MSEDKKLVTPTPIENTTFLNSSAGRSIRVLSEMEEFPHRVKPFGIRGTFLFFGSARAKSQEEFIAEKAKFEAQLVLAAGSGDDKAREAAEAKLTVLMSQEWMCKWYDETYHLSRMLTEWATSSAGVLTSELLTTHFPNSTASKSGPSSTRSTPSKSAIDHPTNHLQPGGVPQQTQALVVCSGGGPGFMMAANKAAMDAGGLSMGVAVTLPFEKNLNPHVTPGLNFRMEYFFTRKFWEVFAAKAVICSPGGMGTCDELFEVLTLIQCGHCPKMPIVLLGGSEFWKQIIDWDKFSKFGVISRHEVDALCFADSAVEAYHFILKAFFEEAAVKENIFNTPPTKSL